MSIIIFTFIAGFYQFTEFNNHKDEILNLVDEKLVRAALNGVAFKDDQAMSTLAQLNALDDITLEKLTFDLSEVANHSDVYYIFTMQKVDDAYQIAKRADVLIYQAKNTGKNHVEFEILSLN